MWIRQESAYQLWSKVYVVISPNLSFYFFRDAVACPILEKTSGFEPLSEKIVQGILGQKVIDTDEFATIPFHLVLFSAVLVELAKSIPVHILILSSHLFFCLPLFLFPFTVPCRIVFARPEDLETWSNHLSFRFLTRVRSSSYSQMSV